MKSSLRARLYYRDHKAKLRQSNEKFPCHLPCIEKNMFENSSPSPEILREKKKRAVSVHSGIIWGQTSKDKQAQILTKDNRIVHLTERAGSSTFLEIRDDVMRRWVLLFFSRVLALFITAAVSLPVSICTPEGFPEPYLLSWICNILLSLEFSTRLRE